MCALNSWVCDTYHTDILMSLQCISFFPIVQSNMPASAQRVISSSTGSFLLSSWAPIIRSDQPELCSFERERNHYCVVSVSSVDLIIPSHFQLMQEAFFFSYQFSQKHHRHFYGLAAKMS